MTLILRHFKVPARNEQRRLPIWLASVLPVLATLVGPPVFGDALDIIHLPPTCIVADKFPELEAQVDASQNPKGVRLYFRSGGASFWSYTEMRSEGGVFRAILMKPPKEAKEMYYYFVATQASGEVRTSLQYLVEVVRSPDRCSDPERVAKSVDSASPKISTGDPLPPTKTARGNSWKRLGLITLGTAVVGGSIVAVTHGGATPPQGSFVGTLSGYGQQISLSGCSGRLDVPPGGTISISLAQSNATASFSFPEGIFTVSAPFDAPCPITVTAPLPPISAQFSQVSSSGNSVSGQAVALNRTFVLNATVSGSTLSGVIQITGGPGGDWKAGLALIYGSRAQ